MTKGLHILKGTITASGMVADWIEDVQYGHEPVPPCVMLCDSTGYEPLWIKEASQTRALSACTMVVVGDNDYDWCAEFTEYVLDK